MNLSWRIRVQVRVLERQRTPIKSRSCDATNDRCVCQLYWLVGLPGERMRDNRPTQVQQLEMLKKRSENLYFCPFSEKVTAKLPTALLRFRRSQRFSTQTRLLEVTRISQKIRSPPKVRAKRLIPSDSKTITRRYLSCKYIS